ncbi:MAG TPA: hypothetical protein VEC19_10440 [Usitatibacter sp.]|nr:hypothetical protein [Usitatibacter sp.]
MARAVADRFAAGLLLLAALALLARIAWVNLVLYEDTGRPRLAHVEREGVPAAPGGVPGIAPLRRILAENPAEVAALVSMAAGHEQVQDIAAADRAYRAALSIAPFDRQVLAVAAAHWLRKSDELGLELLARLIRTHPDARAAAFAALADNMASGGHAIVARLLAGNPAWAGDFVRDACARGVDPMALVPALLARAGSGANVRSEGECVVAKLRAAGRWDHAYQLWLNLLPRERLGHVGYVFNGSFEDPAVVAGFDWILHRELERHVGNAPHVIATSGAAGRRALRVSYGGNRQVRIPASQYLALAPGRYELAGLVRLESLDAVRGIHWTLRCVDERGLKGIFASTERFHGSTDWRRFSAQVVVPAACPAQLLQLEPAVPEGALAVVSGVAWFDDLGLARR